jgi:hypothetical protein
MTRRLVTMLAFAICSIAPAALVNAQTTSVGPYYATPSWDQQLGCSASASCPRFIVLSNWNNEAVLDRETGLVWQRTPIVNVIFLQRSLADAVRTCWTASTGGRQGWRLPRVEELLSLADPSNFANSSLPAGHPFVGVFFIPESGGQVGIYWATDVAPDASGGTVVEFSDFHGTGFPSPTQIGTDGNPLAGEGVWCVRSAAGTQQ